MQAHRHFVVHKPFGFLSQFVYNQKKRKNKKLLGELGSFPEGIMSIGRLDENSEGLLLLTTDGNVSQLVRSKSISKEYYVQVDGIITEEALQKLENGVEISTRSEIYKTRPAIAKRLDPPPVFEPGSTKIRSERHGPTSWVTITISEGKFRQVRKMTAVVGFPTLRLVRVRVGKVMLGQLKAGQVVEVDQFKLK